MRVVTMAPRLVSSSFLACPLASFVSLQHSAALRRSRRFCSWSVFSCTQDTAVPWPPSLTETREVRRGRRPPSVEGAEVEEGWSSLLWTGSCSRLRARLLAGRAWASQLSTYPREAKNGPSNLYTTKGTH